MATTKKKSATKKKKIVKIGCTVAGKQLHSKKKKARSKAGKKLRKC